MYYTTFDARFCGIILAGDETGITHLHLEASQGRRLDIPPSWQRNPLFFKDVKNQVLEYFDGRRHSFDVTLNPQGTRFQKSVWEQLCNIPCGSLASYKDIAKSMGNEKACRAVGGATGKNPVAIIIPCHRVVGSNGHLTGYAHGLDLKEKLIHLEKTSIYR